MTRLIESRRPRSVYFAAAARFGARNVFLLESAGGPEQDCENDYVGLDPLVVITLKGSRIGIEGTPAVVDRILDRMNRLSTRPMSAIDVGRALQRSFECHSGGTVAAGRLPIVFVLGSSVIWDTVPVAPRRAERGLDAIWDAAFVVPRILLHWSKGVPAVAATEFHLADESEERLSMVAALFDSLHDPPLLAPAPLATLIRTASRSDYLDMFTRSYEHILAGDIYQVQIGYELRARNSEHDNILYSRLAEQNPSPYMFQIRIGAIGLTGASPELLLRVEDSRLTMRPLAGTLPRHAFDNDRLRVSLDQDPKEVAEHIMLVDLCRNDLGRVSTFGSVTVSQLMTPATYPSVYHLASTVEGRLESGFDAWDALQACSPAGTVTGTPKIRACQLIAEIEATPRGHYSGTIGLCASPAQLVSALIIRAIVRTGPNVSLRASAGIVAESSPDREWREILTKLARSAAAVTSVDVAR